MSSDSYSAFEDTQLLVRGPLLQVVSEVKRRVTKASDARIYIFSDVTGKEMDFNLQGSEREVLKRLEIYVPATESSAVNSSHPGRPKLGVVSREISLLPRHWEWLATQPGGASSTLRKLIEEAKKKSSGESGVKQAQERTYKVMSVLAGNAEGYEEALRALYRKDKKAFLINIKLWPKDVRAHLVELAKPVFSD